MTEEATNFRPTIFFFYANSSTSGFNMNYAQIYPFPSRPPCSAVFSDELFSLIPPRLMRYAISYE